jgi:hypothetical protein
MSSSGAGTIVAAILAVIVIAALAFVAGFGWQRGG